MMSEKDYADIGLPKVRNLRFDFIWPFVENHIAWLIEHQT